MASENTIFNAMREVCNYFIRKDDIQYYEGTVTIENCELSIEIPSPYVIIRGSRLNDGFYMVLEGSKLKPIVFEEGDVHPMNETFTGRVWFSYPSQDFLALCENIGGYQVQVAQSGGANGVVSESFGSSSRTYAKGKSGGTMTWQETFGNALRTYRKNMFEEIW